MWHKYISLEPIRRLHYEGRELLGQRVYFTEKRDGENVSLWLHEDGVVRISSRNLLLAASDIQARMIATPEYNKIVELLNDDYIDKCIVYGELLKRVSPTRLEPRRKHIHWILFDIYSLKESRFLPYNLVYQIGQHFKIPVVRAIDFFVPESMEHLYQKIEEAKAWCRRHRREGIVGKDYKNQIFFKARIDLPKLPRLKRRQDIKVSLPPMPEEKILRALQHAYDEVGEENWSNKTLAMPVVARHIATEAREHHYSTPRDFYRYYVETPIEEIREETLSEVRKESKAVSEEVSESEVKV